MWKNTHTYRERKVATLARASNQTVNFEKFFYNMVPQFNGSIFISSKVNVTYRHTGYRASLCVSLYTHPGTLLLVVHTSVGPEATCSQRWLPWLPQLPNLHWLGSCGLENPPD